DELNYYREETDPDAIRIPLVRLLPGMAGNVADIDQDSLINADVKNRYQTLVMILTDEEILGEITGAYNDNQGMMVHDDFYGDIYNHENMKVGAKFAIVHVERDIQDRTRKESPLLG